MSLDLESLSNRDKTLLLARLANILTICARDTYEVGSDRVVKPELLRAYNELLHRVTGAARDHLLETEGYPLKAVLEMLRHFGEQHGKTGEMRWAWEQAIKSVRP